MGPLVTYKGAPICKGLVACLALERLFTRVNPFVKPSVIFPDECFRAEAAAEGPFSRVCPFVNGQRITSQTEVRAETALVLFFPLLACLLQLSARPVLRIAFGPRVFATKALNLGIDGSHGETCGVRAETVLVLDFWLLACLLLPATQPILERKLLAPGISAAKALGFVPGRSRGETC